MRRFILLLSLIAFFLPLSIAAAPTTVCDSTLSTGATACYKLEDTADDVGSYTLTNNNSVAFSAAKFNNGADGGASNSNKSLTNSTDIITSESMDLSASCWAKATSLPGTDDNDTVLGISGHGGLLTYGLSIQNNGGTRSVRALRISNGVVGDVADYVYTFSTSAFEQLGLTYNGSTDTLLLYLNGAAVATTTSSGEGVTNRGNGISGLAYKTFDGTPRSESFFSGIVDDCIITAGTVFTPTEMNQIYNGFSPAPGATEEVTNSQVIMVGI